MFSENIMHDQKTKKKKNELRSSTSLVKVTRNQVLRIATLINDGCSKLASGKQRQATPGAVPCKQKNLTEQR